MTNPTESVKPKGAFATTALFAASVLTKLLYKTLRVKADFDTRKILADNASCALIAWHNKIPMLPFVNTYLRLGAPITGLMSKSRDGDFLASFFTHFGVDSERGSSSKNGARSAINLIKILRGGGSICITPDGPRGPKYKAKEGLISICEKSPATRMIFLKINCPNAWNFNSWDNFSIPKPFSRVDIRAFECTAAELKRNAEVSEMTPLEYCEDLLGN